MIIITARACYLATSSVNGGDDGDHGDCDKCSNLCSRLSLIFMSVLRMTVIFFFFDLGLDFRRSCSKHAWRYPRLNGRCGPTENRGKNFYMRSTVFHCHFSRSYFDLRTSVYNSLSIRILTRKEHVKIWDQIIPGQKSSELVQNAEGSSRQKMWYHHWIY